MGRMHWVCKKSPGNAVGSLLGSAPRGGRLEEPGPSYRAQIFIIVFSLVQTL